MSVELDVLQLMNMDKVVVIGKRGKLALHVHSSVTKECIAGNEKSRTMALSVRA